MSQISEATAVVIKLGPFPNQHLSPNSIGDNLSRRWETTFPSLLTRLQLTERKAEQRLKMTLHY